MYATAFLGWLFSLSALLFLFWWLPLALARYAVRRFSGRTSRPVDALMKEVPGMISGLAIGALGVFIVGVSFEDFAVRHARNLGMKGLELVGVDPISRCQARMIETHKLRASTFKEDALNARNFPADPTELEQIYMRYQGAGVILRERTDEQAMMEALESYCRTIQDIRMVPAHRVIY